MILSLASSLKSSTVNSKSQDSPPSSQNDTVSSSSFKGELHTAAIVAGIVSAVNTAKEPVSQGTVSLNANTPSAKDLSPVSVSASSQSVRVMAHLGIDGESVGAALSATTSAEQLSKKYRSSGAQIAFKLRQGAESTNIQSNKVTPANKTKRLKEDILSVQSLTISAEASSVGIAQATSSANAPMSIKASQLPSLKMVKSGLSQMATLANGSGPLGVLDKGNLSSNLGAKFEVAINTDNLHPIKGSVDLSLNTSQVSASNIQNTSLSALTPSEAALLNVVNLTNTGRSARELSTLGVSFQVVQSPATALAHIIGAVGIQMGSNMSVDLIVNPPSLGPITAHIAIDASGLTVNLAATNSQTLDLLGHHLDTLSAELANATGLQTHLDLGGSGFSQSNAERASRPKDSRQVASSVAAIRNGSEPLSKVIEISGYHILDMHL